MFSYQCSQLSTTQSIHDIFETALCFQQNQNTAAFVSVVVLDEIGLAEDSPQLPLKVLHPLLEDGTGSTIKVYIINGTVSAKIAPRLKCYKNASRLNRYNFPTDNAIDFLVSTLHSEMV